MQQQDTDQHRAIHLQHLSPSLVEHIDRRIGELKLENGGYAELMVKFERGHALWYDFLKRFIPQNWRHEPGC